MALSHYEDWLKEYLYYTSGYEVPQLYNKWTGLVLIAAVLKQNVYLPMGESKLYPNIFVVIVDEPSAGKSHAINKFDLDLIRKADEKDVSSDKIYIYEQKITAAAMIKSMSELYKDTKEHCVTVFAEELGFFTDMGGDNSNISFVLTKTFDNTNLPNQTIARSLEYIPNAQLNIIGGTTPDSLKDSIKNKFIKPGVLPRIMFVHSEEVAPPKPFPSPPNENKLRKEYLADELNDFKKLHGAFQWDADAQGYYEQWYYQTHRDFQDRKDKIAVKRMSDKVLKIAMILSVARKHGLVLELDDIIDAIKIRNEALDNYLYINTKLTTSEFGEKVQSVLDIIKANKEIKHSDLMHKVHHWMGTPELHNVIMTLEDAELIEIKTITTINAKKPTNVYKYKG